VPSHFNWPLSHSSFKHFFGLLVFVITAEAYRRIEPSNQFVSMTFFSEHVVLTHNQNGALHIFFISAGVSHVDLFMHHTQFTCGLYQPSSLTTDRKLKEV
jgi:hypothetical protein